MKFAAVIEYTQDKDRIQQIRPVHREYLAKLKENKQLAASGPFTDDSGALIIYEADTAEAAEELLKGDPFHENGIFVSYGIRPWNPVIFNGELFS